MRGRQHREAGSQARAEDADRFVSLLREPADGAPRVEHRLPAHLRRPADVGAHDVVGATELGGPSVLVVGKREPERRQLELVQQPAQPDMPGRIGVPLGQHQHGTAPARWRQVGKEPGAHDVVLGMRRGERARKGQAIAVQRVLVAWRQIEVGAARRRPLCPPTARAMPPDPRPSRRLDRSIPAPTRRAGRCDRWPRRRAAVPSRETRARSLGDGPLLGEPGVQVLVAAARRAAGFHRQGRLRPAFRP